MKRKIHKGTRIYAIMSYSNSPVAITHPKVIGYVATRSEAKDVVSFKNLKATKSYYFYESVPYLMVVNA